MQTAQAQTPAFSPADLDMLATQVEFGKCALVLGPAAYPIRLADGQTMASRHVFSMELAEEYALAKGKKLPEPTNLGLVGSAWLAEVGKSPIALQKKAIAFYKNQKVDPAILAEVAQLPFRLVFTTSPCGLLQEVYRSKSARPFRDNYYRFGKTQPKFDEDAFGDATFIYQLFGRVLDMPDDSIPLTLDDQLKYVDSVQGVGVETRIPSGLRNAMKDCEAFLFVGFDYENWYLRVLFHILQFSRDAQHIFGLPEGRSAQMNDGTAAFFSRQFKFSFLSEKPLDLLRAIRHQIDMNGDVRPAEAVASRTLLYLFHPKDESFKDKLDRQLAMVKKTHAIVGVSIHDFEASEVSAHEKKLIEDAFFVVAVLSPDFLADENLSERLLKAALARKSDSVGVVGAFARQTYGVSEFSKDRFHVFPSANWDFSTTDEGTRLAMIASAIDRSIAALKHER